MRSAVLLQSGGTGLHAVGDEPAATRLRRQLEGQGVEPIVVVSTGGAGSGIDLTELRGAVVRQPAGDVVLTHESIVAHDEAWTLLLDDPRVATATITSRGGLPGATPIRTTAGRIEAPDPLAESPAGTRRHAAPVLVVADAHRGILDAALATIAELPARTRGDTLVGTIIGELAHRGVPVSTVGGRGLAFALVADEPSAADVSENLARVDGQKVLLNSAVKAEDGFFTTFFVSPYSKYIARWCARRGFDPNQVTVFSLLLGLMAAVAFAVGTRTGLIVGAVALQVSFTFDCVDGQLARYIRRFSALGAWMDSMFDRTKEYAAFAGLAYGGVRQGESPTTMWTLATAALAAQGTRHLVDFAFGAHRRSLSEDDESDEARHARPAQTATLIERVSDMVVRYSAASERLPAVKWIKRMLVLPIGERFAVISFTAAIWGPRTTFVVLFAWASIAATYTLAGRILRSLR